MGERKKLIKGLADKFAGNPAKVAQAVLRIAEMKNPPLHLLLGNDVLAAFRHKLAELSASLDEWEETTKDVGFPG